MRFLNLPDDAASPLKILCLGAHSDDIEIGCGGTILRLAQEYTGCVFHWVVFSALGVRAAEAQRAAELFAGMSAVGGPLLKTFHDGFMPFVGAEVKAVFEELKQEVSPDLIFTHNRKDAHQDHRLLAELTWNTFRDHLILEYEIPKYDGDMGQPSVFVPLTTEVCEKKVRYIMDTFQSQHAKRWFQPDTFFSLLRLRGMECNAPSGYAEAFYCRKMVL
jgi:LmbE family N-acetylglucosaminyl deacetylase